MYVPRCPESVVVRQVIHSSLLNTKLAAWWQQHVPVNKQNAADFCEKDRVESVLTPSALEGGFNAWAASAAISTAT